MTQKEKFVDRFLFASRLFATVVFPAALPEVFQNLALLPRRLKREPLFLLPVYKPLKLRFERLLAVCAEFLTHRLIVNLGASHARSEALLQTSPRIPRLEFKFCDFLKNARDQRGNGEESKLLESFEARAEFQNWLKRETKSHLLSLATQANPRARPQMSIFRNSFVAGTWPDEA